MSATDSDASGEGGEGSRSSVVVELLKLVEPVVTAVEDGPLGVKELLDDMGVTEQVLGQDGEAVFDQLESEVKSNGGNLIETVKGIIAAVDEVDDIDSMADVGEVDWGTVMEEVDVQELKEAGKSAKAIFESIKALQDVELQDPDMGNLGDTILDYLIIRYLRTYQGQVYGWCKTFDVIRAPKEGERRPEELDLERLVEALEDPNEIPKEVFNWAAEEGTEFLASILLERLMQVFWGQGVHARMPGATEQEMKNLTGVSNVEDLDDSGLDAKGAKLLVPLIGYQISDGTSFETGVKLIPLPPDPSENDWLPGVALVTYGTLTGDMTGDLGGGWQVDVDGEGELANRGVAINPTLNDGVETNFVNVESSDATVQGTTQEDQLVFTIGVSYGGEGTEVQKRLMGTAVGTLDMNGAEIAGTFEYVDDEVEVGAELTTTGTLAVDPQGGFLDKVIPEPIEYDFSVTAGWSSTSGFYLQQGGSLEIALAENIPLGPLQIKETFLGIEPPDLGDGGGSKPPALPTTVAGSPEIDLGFLFARVERMGIKNELAFPEDGGNLGPVDHSIGFRPPDGLALSVDAGPVSGGGVLNFYPEENRYSGALQLQIKTLSITAVGLLRTELPGGRDGFSLLLLITAEFPPIQLGFGFSLNGLGGLLGINRSMKSKPLGDAIRAGNVSSILFPRNVVENADRIISDLRSIFPPTADMHVAGPMAKLGWGTPTMLTMEVGVVLQFPTLKIAIVGAFHLALPDQDAGLVKLNLAVVGIIDPPNQKLSIDASLYDSRIVMWTVSGDMAMRLYWGDDSRFLLSIGGFHPRYEAPSGFPELARIKASMSGPSGNLRLEYKGYMATTPNTFQVGAGVYLHAEVGPITAKGELSFDALFQFDPFKFIIDFLAKLAIKFKGKGLELKIDGTLKGPGPFHVKGTVSIDILMFSVTVNVDETIGSGGDTEGMPPATVMPKLTEEFGKSENWSAQLPDTAGALVTIADPGAGSESGGGGQSESGGDEEGPVLVHPLGGLGVRQQYVPLRERVDKVGNAVPSDYRKFRIGDVLVDGESLADRRPAREKFAPAKFRKMSDSEKMNAEPFVTLAAGTRAGGSLVYYPGSEDDVSDDRAAELRRTATLEYETAVVDEERQNHGEPLTNLGRFADLRMDAARVGTPLSEIPRLVGQTAAAEAGAREDFVGGRPTVYGAPGGVVIGSRGDRSDRIADAAIEIDPADAVATADGGEEATLLTEGAGVTTLSTTAASDTEDDQ